MENGDERRNSRLGDESWRAKTITDETGGGEGKLLKEGEQRKEGKEGGRKLLEQREKREELEKEEEGSSTRERCASLVGR